MPIPKSVLITGASSGIGEALALAYAGPGISLFLSGRDDTRLAQIAGACRDRGADAHGIVLDVRERDRMAAWIAQSDSTAPLELVIANAGISGGTGGSGEADEQARRIFDVNVTGVLNTLQPAMPLMKARGRGQLAIMSSLASFRGFPGAPAYCASKAAVRVLGEGLRGHLAVSGIGVSVICPGFVISRMTAANRFRMPLLMESGRAARIIQRGLARNQARIAFPWRGYMMARLLAALPASLTERILAKTPAKE